MHPDRRVFTAWIALGGVAGCAGAQVGAMLAAQVGVLAPAGALRIGVFLGNPSSLLRDADGRERGVTVDLGRELAARLSVPARLLEFPRLAAVLDALEAGEIDFTITHATPARAARADFTPPLLEIELGYLLPPGSPIATIADVDREGVRVGVSQGSTSQGVLARRFARARVVPTPSLDAAHALLAGGQVDAFATSKAILHELADQLPGARILPGRWGLEQLAIAIPRGRDAAMPALRGFADDARARGLVRRAADRAGLRGLRADAS